MIRTYLIAWPLTCRIAHVQALIYPSPDFNDPNPRSRPPGASNTYAPPTAGPPPASGKNPFSTKRYLWSLSFYSQFFDVDTSEVLRRCQAALFPRANFLDVLDGNPDLYGPFWIATTVVIILFLSGTINRWLEEKGDEHYAYDFKLLSGTAFCMPKSSWASPLMRL